MEVRDDRTPYSLWTYTRWTTHSGAQLVHSFVLMSLSKAYQSESPLKDSRVLRPNCYKISGMFSKLFYLNQDNHLIKSRNTIYDVRFELGGEHLGGCRILLIISFDHHEFVSIHRGRLPKKILRGATRDMRHHTIQSWTLHKLPPHLTDQLTLYYGRALRS